MITLKTASLLALACCLGACTTAPQGPLWEVQRAAGSDYYVVIRDGIPAALGYYSVAIQAGDRAAILRHGRILGSARVVAVSGKPGLRVDINPYVSPTVVTISPR